MYEAHSTDYQTREALRNLVRDHFGILKVGPGLTFAYREAIFALAAIENELCKQDDRSDIVQVLDDVMLEHPEHWKKYYLGTFEEQAFKRKYSLSDRARYYWAHPKIQAALLRLIKNLGEDVLPYSLLAQFTGRTGRTASQVMALKVRQVLDDYLEACGSAE